jgi:hypothetical protein
MEKNSYKLKTRYKSKQIGNAHSMIIKAVKE